jgi:hypothetical protein
VGLGGSFLLAAERDEAVKRRVRMAPGAKIFRMIRMDIPSPANLSELKFSVRPL